MDDRVDLDTRRLYGDVHVGAVHCKGSQEGGANMTGTAAGKQGLGRVEMGTHQKEHGNSTGRQQERDKNLQPQQECRGNAAGTRQGCKRNAAKKIGATAGERRGSVAGTQQACSKTAARLKMHARCYEPKCNCLCRSTCDN